MVGVVMEKKVSKDILEVVVVVVFSMECVQNEVVEKVVRECDLVIVVVGE